jgi:hypothetical protein
MMKIPECFPDSIAYLGDGAYVGHDSIQLWVAAERDGLIHRVALGATELAELIRYARQVGLVAEDR